MHSPLPCATCPFSNRDLFKTWIAIWQSTNGEFLSFQMELREWRVFESYNSHFKRLIDL